MVPKVSIIVPAYNAEKDIGNCLQTLVDQTYTDYEVIVVDDGSKDDTVAVVSVWNKKDARIKLVKNTRKGVSSARNFGVAAATGKYISFLDSDDMLSPVFLQTLVSLIEDHKCECASVAYTVSINNLEKSVDLGKSVCYDDKTCFGMLTQMSGGSGGYVWNKMYLSDIIKNKNILFDENISAGEDLLFNFYYFRNVKKVSFCNANLYYYRLRSDSAINRLDNPKWFELIMVYNLIMNSQMSSDVLDEFRCNYALLLQEGSYRLKYCNSDHYTHEELKNLKKNNTKLSLKFSFKQNVKILLFHLTPEFAMKFRRRSIGG